MVRMERVLSVRAFGGLDQLLRLVNALRRGSAEVRGFEVRFIGKEIVAFIRVDGGSEEIKWVAKKIYSLPEVKSVDLIENELLENPILG